MPNPTLSRVNAPGYLRDHWNDRDPAPWAAKVALGVMSDPVVLPLTRLSGSLVYPVLKRAQLHECSGEARGRLEITLVSVSPPSRALHELLQLRAYGHTFVLLPPGYAARFFDMAELDFRGVGVASAVLNGSLERLIPSSGVPAGLRLEPWWRSTREAQLRQLARA